MKAIAEKDNQIILRFDAGEDVVSGLAAFAKKRGIDAASLNGLGSAKEIEISWYDLQTRGYERKTITEDLEILPLTGNIAMLKNDHVIHMHGVFGRRDLSVIGGHVHRLDVLATAEVTILVMSGTSLHRVKDEKTGLNLLR